MNDNPPGEPFAALIPLLRALERGGNVAAEGGFVNSQGGWYCEMRDPIDFEILRDSLEIPQNIELSEENDSILDRWTWCAILGPNAS